ncbi:MAG: RDD family protein [Bdellovibrionales bacterium]|nr:RDD family protein [Bdellovibrionales bacterium]
MDREKSKSGTSSADQPVRFAPLTDGLGFHPFADGLPYAPAGKSANPSNASLPSAPMGTGAVAAGRPQFVYPSPAVTAAAKVASRATAPVPRLPTMGSSVDETVDRIRRELESIQHDRIDQARANAAEVKALQSGLRHSHGLGYVFERSFAYILDSAFNLSVCASILSTALISTDLDNLNALSSGAMLTVAGFLFLCNWALIAAQEVAFGTTIGKRIFGLRLDGNGFECFIRALFFLPSLFFGGLGLLVALFDARKRCWHDRMTKLQPEHWG